MTRKSLVVEVCKYSFHFIRNTIATVSYRSEISVPKARVALRAVCEILYDHKYLLNPPPLATIPEESETGEPYNKKPRTADDYELLKITIIFYHMLNQSMSPNIKNTIS